MNKIIIFLITIFCLFFFYGGDSFHFSSRVYFTSETIMFLSTIMIFQNDNRPYSLRKMFYIFSFFFFGIAPLIQFQSGTSSFGARILKEDEYFHMNVLIIFILIFFELFYKFFSKTYDKQKNRLNEKYELKQTSIKQILVLLLLSLGSLIFVLNVNSFEINRLLFRGGEFVGDIASDSGLSSSTNLIITQALRPLAMICLLYYLLTPNRKFIITFILFITALLTVFPTGVARFYAAAVYIPLLIILIKSFEKKFIFSLFFIGGFLVIFPFLNNFRHFSKNTELKLKLDFEMFTEGHFDSYQNFALIYFENIITYGMQLLGVVFFWIPRTLWPNKPIGSGYLLAEKMKFTWNNVSANFFAEGFINFGYVGILIFILVLSYFTSKMDNLYWMGISKKNSNFFKIIYLIMMGMLFFMMRGDLLSSTAFTVGFMMSILIVFTFVHKRT